VTPLGFAAAAIQAELAEARECAGAPSRTANILMAGASRVERRLRRRVRSIHDLIIAAEVVGE